MLQEIFSTTINSFDFGFCLSVNILTYLLIQIAQDLRHKELSTWGKRLMLILAILPMGVVYYLTDNNPKLLINSAILAPVSWTWIFKPIFNKFLKDE